MNEEITDVKPPKGFAHITDLVGSEATILQVANSQGDILGYATLDDIDAYIQNKVAQTIHSFTQKQTFQDVTINGTFDGNNVINQEKLNSALDNKVTVYKHTNNMYADTRSMLLEYISQCRTGVSVLEITGAQSYQKNVIIVNKASNSYFTYISTSYYSAPRFSTGYYEMGTWG